MKWIWYGDNKKEELANYDDGGTACTYVACRTTDPMTVCWNENSRYL